ncbi:hypothetical protein [Amycolatopsis sp. H20-H5]|uniref:hypothetical protein n=1 Tax=Amycolatopsis sp. H20-H5 TaxID=3046309 RepID=UPI002DBDC298|nr:hypothetical protein [Amycolatopsis sp. H20-H5]MEC3974865.1 hypothetical protein [Amycolatopsis sp. H20-H5]
MIRVTDNGMSSEAGDHRAYRLDHWLVSWLPQRVLSREEALIAMTLADIYSGEPAANSSWGLVARDYEKALSLPRSFRPSWFRHATTEPVEGGDGE